MRQDEKKQAATKEVLIAAAHRHKGLTRGRNNGRHRYRRRLFLCASDRPPNIATFPSLVRPAAERAFFARPNIKPTPPFLSHGVLFFLLFSLLFPIVRLSLFSRATELSRIGWHSYWFFGTSTLNSITEFHRAHIVFEKKESLGYVRDILWNFMGYQVCRNAVTELNSSNFVFYIEFHFSFIKLLSKKFNFYIFFFQDSVNLEILLYRINILSFYPLFMPIRILFS